MNKTIPPILLVLAIAVILVIATPQQTPIDPKACTTDDDCAVFGETGDCNCGCFNKNYTFWTPGGECFCLAPTSCKCTDNQCEDVFE